MLIFKQIFVSLSISVSLTFLNNQPQRKLNSMTPKFVPALTSLPLIRQGKTRDTFSTKSPDALLIVATQRLSTHNIVHLSEVPYKDQVLTALTIYWLTNVLAPAGVKHHLIAHGGAIYDYLPKSFSHYPADLHHRAIVVKKLDMIPVEFIFRGYLVGSLYKDFHVKGLPNPYGIILDPDLPLMEPFDEPIFTPTDKSETDVPIDAENTEEKYPEATAVCYKTFLLVRDHLRKLGLELVDSKFEVGICNNSGQPIVTIADEIATPDSSRFCDDAKIEIGKEPPWLDKQIARDEAERIWGKGKKTPLIFSPDIVSKLSGTYLDIFFRITGMNIEEFQKRYMQ